MKLEEIIIPAIAESYLIEKVRQRLQTKIEWAVVKPVPQRRRHTKSSVYCDDNLMTCSDPVRKVLEGLAQNIADEAIKAVQKKGCVINSIPLARVGIFPRHQQSGAFLFKANAVVFLYTRTIEML